MNEDAYLADAGHLLFGVFDGLGATAQGAEAAGLAAEAIRAAYDQHGDGGDCAAERAFLLLTVRGAGQLIAATLEDGFTTASVVKVCNVTDGAATALICNIGDSRVYRYTTAGVLHQCTLDDSPFGSDWELQLRLSEVAVPTGLLEYTYFERRHVMDHALGERLASPRLWEVPADDGDVLLAVSDGVTDNLTFSELRRLLAGRCAHDPVDIGPSARRRGLRPQPPDQPPASQDRRHHRRRRPGSTHPAIGGSERLIGDELVVGVCRRSRLVTGCAAAAPGGGMRRGRPGGRDRPARPARPSPWPASRR